jgi:hypothetical protein
MRFSRKDLLRILLSFKIKDFHIFKINADLSKILITKSFKKPFLVKIFSKSAMTKFKKLSDINRN